MIGKSATKPNNDATTSKQRFTAASGIRLLLLKDSSLWVDIQHRVRDRAAMTTQVELTLWPNDRR